MSASRELPGDIKSLKGLIYGVQTQFDALSARLDKQDARQAKQDAHLEEIANTNKTVSSDLRDRDCAGRHIGQRPRAEAHQEPVL